MIEYWHWHTLPYGAETYWGGVLPHSLRPGRVYAEVAGIGEQLSRLGHTLDGFEPDADVALLWSVPSRFAMQFMPPLHTGGGADPESYEHIFDSFYRGVIDSGRQVRILHVEQAVEVGAADMARRFPVLVVPGAYVLRDAEITFLHEYAAAGGHLVLGPRTAYADEEARVRVDVAPAGLKEAAGVWYEEFSNIDAPLEVVARGADLSLDASAATGWVDGLITEGARVLAEYRHPRFGAFPAITTHEHGAGRVSVVGTVPGPSLSRSIAEWLVPRPLVTMLGVHADAPALAVSGILPDDRHVFFVFNWGWEPQSVVLTSPFVDLLRGDPLTPAQTLSLGPWDVRVLVAERE